MDKLREVEPLFLNLLNLSSPLFQGADAGPWCQVPPQDVNVWQKPPQYCKVISLQLKFYKKEKKSVGEHQKKKKK